MSSISKLCDENLLKSLASLNSDEVETVARILVHLMEVDKRRLYAAKGHSSLFTYCVEVLKYCEGTAGRRVTASRCIDKFPSILRLFLDQKINLTTIVLISKIITKENKNEVLKAVCNKRKSEVEKYVAIYLPEKTIRERIKVLPSLVKEPFVSANAPQNIIEADIQAETKLASGDSDSTIDEIGQQTYSSSGAGNLLEKQAFVANFEIKLKAKESAVAKLKRVQELRGRKESLGDLFEILLDEYLEKHSPESRSMRRKSREESTTRRKERGIENQRGSGSSDNLRLKQQVNAAPPSPARTKSARHVPQKIKDELFFEHAGQCAFIAPNGIRCSCRRGLQVDHVYPFAAGGSSNKGNLRLLCPTHNRYAAEVFYGLEKMRAFRVKEVTASYQIT